MTFNIRNSLDLLLVFFGIIKEIYILSFFKLYIYFLIFIYLNYNTIVDQ